ncbi:amino acid permease [bacterium]|nr:amino acid permease [bacterium]
MPDPTSPADARRYGYWTGHLVVVGSMIGAGILITSGYTLRDTGNPVALLGVWVVGGVLAVCGALTVAELAVTLPRSGGDYVFVRAAFGRGAGVVSGWATFTLGFAAPTALIAHTAFSYLLSPYADVLTAHLPGWLAERAVPIGATALILAVGIGHSLGHRHSTGLQTAATLTTVAVLLALGVGGLLFGIGSWTHLEAGGWPRGGEWPALATGLIYVGYAYAGWNGAAYIAGEIRDPARILPRCLVGGAATVMALYLLVNLAYVYALDPVAMTERSEAEVKQVATLAARALFGADFARVTAAAIGLSLTAAVSSYLLTGPRVAYAMARDAVFPRYAGLLHPVRGTPAAATLTQAALAVGLVWSGRFEDLLDYTTVGLAALSGLTVASVFPLRRRADLPHPYRLPLYPLPPLAFLVLTAWTVAHSVYEEKTRTSALLSLATILAGIPLARLLPAAKPAATP